MEDRDAKRSTELDSGLPEDTVTDTDSGSDSEVDAQPDGFGIPADRTTTWGPSMWTESDSEAQDRKLAFHVFTGLHDLMLALAESLPTLARTPRVFGYLPRNLHGRALCHSYCDPRITAKEIVMLLIGPGRRELLQAVTEFVRSQPKLSFCLAGSGVARPHLDVDTWQSAAFNMPPDCPKTPYISVQSRSDFKMWGGDRAINNSFTTSIDLTIALTRSLPALVHTPCVMEHLHPWLREQALRYPDSDPWSIAEQVVVSLEARGSTKLLQAVTEFVRSRPELSFCLAASAAAHPHLDVDTHPAAFNIRADRTKAAQTSVPSPADFEMWDRDYSPSTPFTTSADLMIALTRSLPALANTRRVMELLPPDIQGRALTYPHCDPWGTASRVAGFLSIPKGKELLPLLIEFIRSRPELSFCLAAALRLFGESFIERVFTSVADLTEALAWAMPALICRTSFINLLPDTSAARIRYHAAHDGFVAAEQVVLLLLEPRRTELQKEILDFIRAHWWMHPCLQTSVASRISESDPVAGPPTGHPAPPFARLYVPFDRRERHLAMAYLAMTYPRAGTRYLRKAARRRKTAHPRDGAQSSDIVATVPSAVSNHTCTPSDGPRETRAPAAAGAWHSNREIVLLMALISMTSIVIGMVLAMLLK